MRAGIGGGPHPSTARELQAVIHAERAGTPFFVYREPAGAQRIVHFGPERRELTVGRNASADLCLAWDDQVSALHAVIERHAGELTLLDDGLSRNGSYVNGEPVHRIRRLRDGDVLRFGRASVLVRHAGNASRGATSSDPGGPPLAADLSDQQRKVLRALCRPMLDGSPFAGPATNHEIADQLHLSVAAVKLHLRALFDKFDVAELPQNKKRLVLARRAVESGVVGDAD